MLGVSVNGFGTIGKRVADAVSAQPDMTVVGVSKRSPNHEARSAAEAGYDLYAADPDRVGEFGERDIPVAGSVGHMLAASDVVVDATPAGVGESYREQYADHDVAVVYQGGEDASVAPNSFCARANYDLSVDETATRVVSCNTTGLARAVTPLDEAYGVESVDATLIRRGGDPTQTDRGPINDIVPDPVEVPSHHAPDLRTILPGIDVTTTGVTVPATLMHLHSVTVSLDADPAASEVRERFEAEPRLQLITTASGCDSCADIQEYARDIGRPRGDVWENCIWADSLDVSDGRLTFFQAIHQQADVVPESVDAVRALAGTAAAGESRDRTDEALGVGM
ncbi:type II glyceraldehyde-3-phosphate dehydrogenase [Haloarcula onubensis]|uniref:Glyceraldehyde-3-phosphate dehydrogenase n=1 Tax=Haloarcula onubensis TaxID=2950539 RepID=A0ABU2FKK1_9EURY|nr:type II glyceraldehyde-3-phosphate dehydrogenase [Halomicroarcula sp. S3CR25-11]MDS0280731.1 type II glyceraldehyde-3-phosphate dehydrogenase [Halomicroarcula sp. S3CR25-11]